MTYGLETPPKTSYYRMLVLAAVFGALSSLLTAAYITLYNQGIKFFEKPHVLVLGINVWPFLLVTIVGLLIGIMIKFLGQHAGLGVPQRQYGQTGRIDPRYLPRILLQGFTALWSGAAIGPEGLLVFLCGGVGTFIADRLKLEKKDVPLLVYSTIAGAFGGFLGSPIVGAIGAVEYMYIRELDFYRHLIPGLLAAASGYVMYFAVLHTSYLGIYSFPSYASPHLVDLGWAVLIGVISGFVGILFKLIFGFMHRVFSPLNKRPVVRAVAGSVIVGVIAIFLPLTLYSGQEQLLQIIHNPAAYGVGLLLLMFLAKAFLTSTSFATGFDGGPLFPLIFIGGLAISKILTFIPQGVGVTAGMAGVTAAAFPIPLTVTLMLGMLGGQPDLTPAIAIGAVTGFVVSKALAPYLPKPRPTSSAEPP